MAGGYAAAMRALTTLLLLGLIACSEAPPPPAAEAAGPPRASVAEAAYRVSQWTLPASGSAAQPDLVADARGRLLLSWISVEPEGHALRLAVFEGGRWSEVAEIARGDDWFVNWADTPHVAATDDGALWAHWLRKSADAPYAYDVVLSRSGDGGATWAAPVLVNDDATPTEHGFVSMWPHSRDAIGIAWLDGRDTRPQAHAGHAGHDDHGAGAMTLRTALVDARLQRSAERRLDARTCDCWQTSAAATARGALLVYRDRDQQEVRDIAATRFDQGAWTPAAHRARRPLDHAGVPGQRTVGRRARRYRLGRVVHGGRGVADTAAGALARRGRAFRPAGERRPRRRGAGPSHGRGRSGGCLDRLATRGRGRTVAVAWRAMLAMLRVKCGGGRWPRCRAAVARPDFRSWRCTPAPRTWRGAMWWTASRCCAGRGSGR